MSTRYEEGYRTRAGASTERCPENVTMRALSIAAVALLQCHCAHRAEPVPATKLDHVGLWEGTEMRLLITRDGAFSYQRWGNGSHKEMRGSVGSWQADGFNVGTFPFRTSFKVDPPPHRSSAQWRMTVDGVALHKVEGSGFVGDLSSSFMADLEPPPEGPPRADLAPHSDFLGVWEAPEMRLAIRRDGNLSYRRIQSGASPGLEAPIASMSTKAIVAGGGLEISFRIDAIPHRVGNQWRMTVDGVELRRVLVVPVTSNDVPTDPAQLQERCAGGDKASCNNLGAYNEDGVGIPKELVRSAELYAKACAGDFPLGCANLGKLYLEGTGVAKDVPKAKELYERACDLGGPEGCFGLGFLYDNGTGVAEDDAAAARLLATGCNGNVATSCARLGSFYVHAEGVPRDYARALQLYTKACDAGDTFGCANLGGLYANGLGTAKDPARAETLLRKACAAGDGDSCTAVERLHAH
jgi:hypothetical protein